MDNFRGLIDVSIINKKIKLVRIRGELEKYSLTVDHEVNNDLMTIMDQNPEK